MGKVLLLLDRPSYSPDCVGTGKKYENRFSHNEAQIILKLMMPTDLTMYIQSELLLSGTMVVLRLQKRNTHRGYYTSDHSYEIYQTSLRRV